MKRCRIESARFVGPTWLLGLVFAGGAAAEVPWAYPDPDNELIVVWQPADALLSLTADDLIAAVERPSGSERNLLVFNRLQRPALARFLVEKRLPTDALRSLDADDPEVRMQYFVVLTYSDNTRRETAFEILKADRAMRAVDRNLRLTYAVSPTDPLYNTPSPDLRRYQWGPEANQGIVVAPDRTLQQAWDKVRGTAYVAVLDNGIQTNPTLHPDLTQNVRMQFSRNYFSANAAAIDELADVPAGSIFAGHGTHVAGIIAANTTNPVSQAGYPNPPAAGGAGVCWFCNLMVLRVTAPGSGGRPAPSMANTAAALTRAAQIGAQVVNISFGRTDSDCSFGGDNQAICTALAFAINRDVIVVAAVGNRLVGPPVGDITCDNSIIDFPASLLELGAPGSPSLTSNVIPVGASTHLNGAPADPNSPVRWIETGTNPVQQSNCGPRLTTRGLMAPGAVVVSSFYAGRDWNPGFGCGDNPFLGSDPPNYDDLLGTGYGRCTGTSMATPFVTGVVALMRSVNPRNSRFFIIAKLLQSSSKASAPSNDVGSGMVNASAAVDLVLAAAGNRLTPLFAFYNSTWGDRFYTIVPQMGSAAVKDTMAVRNPIIKAILPYAPVGSLIFSYAYPTGDVSPISASAQVWVFSTHVNPFGGQELRPLLRYSYACYDVTNYPVNRPICGANRTENVHIDHAYVSNTVDGDALIAAGYRFDGIEGFLLPQAANKRTVALLRARNADIDDWAVFPETEQSAMADLKYTQGVSILGYVYLNNGTQPTL